MKELAKALVRNDFSRICWYPCWDEKKRRLPLAESAESRVNQQQQIKIDSNQETKFQILYYQTVIIGNFRATLF